MGLDNHLLVTDYYKEVLESGNIIKSLYTQLAKQKGLRLEPGCQECAS